MAAGVSVSVGGAPVRLECPFTYSKFLCGAAAPAPTVAAAASGLQNLSLACIDTLLECDDAPNCPNGEDERSCLPPASQPAPRAAAGTVY